ADSDSERRRSGFAGAASGAPRSGSRWRGRLQDKGVRPMGFWEFIKKSFPDARERVLQRGASRAELVVNVTWLHAFWLAARGEATQAEALPVCERPTLSCCPVSKKPPKPRKDDTELIGKCRGCGSFFNLTTMIFGLCERCHAEAKHLYDNR